MTDSRIFTMTIENPHTLRKPSRTILSAVDKALTESGWQPVDGTHTKWYIHGKYDYMILSDLSERFPAYWFHIWETTEYCLESGADPFESVIRSGWFYSGSDISTEDPDYIIGRMEPIEDFMRR